MKIGKEPFGILQVGTDCLKSKCVRSFHINRADNSALFSNFWILTLKSSTLETTDILSCIVDNLD